MTLSPSAKLLWYDARGTDGTDPKRMHAIYECDGKRIVIRADEPEPELLVQAIAAKEDAPSWVPGTMEFERGQGYILALSGLAIGG